MRKLKVNKEAFDAARRLKSTPSPADGLVPGRPLGEREIACRLGISERTLERYLQAIRNNKPINISIITALAWALKVPPSSIIEKPVN